MTVTYESVLARAEFLEEVALGRWVDADPDELFARLTRATTGKSASGSARRGLDVMAEDREDAKATEALFRLAKVMG